MTKPKPADELQKRGRKPSPANDRGVWIAIELRRKLEGFGRSDTRSLSRAIDYVQRDQASLTSSKVTTKGLRKRYDRIEKLRRADPSYAAQLDREVSTIEGIVSGLKGPGLVLPLSVHSAKPGI